MWFFERSDNVLELETRFDNETAEYVVELRVPNIEPQAEPFTTSEDFRKRLIALENGLSGQRWRRIGPPALVPDGWPDRKPSR